MTDFDDAADPTSETLEQRLRAKAEQIHHDRPDTLGANLSVLLLEAAATIAAVAEPDERTVREGVNAARDLWVDGAEFDDAVSTGIGVAFGLAVGEQSAIAEGSVGDVAALKRSPPELTGAESPQPSLQTLLDYWLEALEWFAAGHLWNRAERMAECRAAIHKAVRDALGAALLGHGPTGGQLPPLEETKPPAVAQEVSLMMDIQKPTVSPSEAELHADGLFPSARPAPPAALRGETP